MRKLIFILLFITTSLFAELEWSDDYKSALKSAKAQNKHVVLMFSKEDCSLCEVLHEILFPDPSVVALLEKDFILLELDTEYDNRRGFKVYSTPTIYFLSTKGKKQGNSMTKQFTAENLKKRLQETLNTKQAKIPLSKHQDIFYDKNRDANRPFK